MHIVAGLLGSWVAGCCPTSPDTPTTDDPTT
jgi:hypothetical protein